MIKITKKGKGDAEHKAASHNEKLTVENNQKGEVIITEVGEFGFYELIVGPPATTYNVFVYMDMDPDPDNQEWQLLLTAARDKVANLDLYKWVADDLMTVKNGIKIEIENKDGADVDFFYFAPVAGPGQVANRKY